MLAPRASGALICLRCELRLTQPRFPRLRRQAQQATFSASTRLRRQDAAAELVALSQAQSQGQSQEHIQEQPQEKPQEQIQEQPQEQQPTINIAREVQPLNRWRKGRKGKVIRETSEKLGGLKTLGHDAEILVLQEFSSSTREEPEMTSQPAELLEVPDIHAALQEDTSLTSKDIYTRIEGLRPHTPDNPNEPHYVRKRVFKKLSKALQDGFTQKQLKEYYWTAMRKMETEVNVAAKKPAEKGLVERSLWQPGTTALKNRVPGLGKEYFQQLWRKDASKKGLTDHILKEVWQLVMLEEIESTGELELSLPRGLFELLIAGGEETMLGRISTHRKAGIQTRSVGNSFVVRITADKTTTEYTASDIEEALKSSITKQLPLKAWTPLLDNDSVKNMDPLSCFKSSDLEMVSKMTRTAITRNPKNLTITIRGFDQSAVEEAERLLIKLLPLKDDLSKYSIDTRRLDAEESSTYLLPTFYQDNAISHKLRDTSFGRWSMAVARKVASESTVEEKEKESTARTKALEAADQRLKKHIVEAIRPSAKGVDRSKAVGYWVPEPEDKLVAHFGQVLYPLTHNGIAPSWGNLPARSAQSPFLPSVPGLSNILTSGKFLATARMEAPSLVYDFIPDPASFGNINLNAEDAHKLPSLYIQMRTNPQGNKPILHKLSLSTQQRIHDVLLPEAPVDLRFIQYQRVRFRQYHDDKNVKAWTAAVVQNIESGGRLTAPSITLDLPKWTLPGHAPDAKGVAPIKFLFSSIQFRQIVMGKLDDLSVSYTTVQTGKLGATGAVLSAYYNSHRPPGREDEPDNDLNPKTFVKKCFAAVQSITQAARESQSVARKIKPRQENSERRAKRKGRERLVPSEADLVSSTAAMELRDRIRGSQVADEDVDVDPQFSTFLSPNTEEDTPVSSETTLSATAPVESEEDVPSPFDPNSTATTPVESKEATPSHSSPEATSTSTVALATETTPTSVESEVADADANAPKEKEKA